MKRVTQLLYGLVGAGAVTLGVIAVFAPGFILPDAQTVPLAGHLAREQGAEFVFIGLMALWCLCHYDARRPVHLAFVVLTALFAGIHWSGYLRSGHYLAAAVANSVPFVAFAMTAPWKKS
jgi:hypothetical protein